MTPEEYGRALGSVGPSLLQVLSGLESARRYLHPPAIPRLREMLTPRVERFETARRELDGIEPPGELEALHARLERAVEHVATAARLFLEPADGPDAAPRMLESMRQHDRAQEALYPLRIAIPPIGKFFTDPALHTSLAELDPEPPDGVSVGLHTSGSDAAQRGGFALYVPETYDGSEALPLVVALHGGSGSGRDFIWTWLREARSRRFLLLAPTARGATWSFNGPDVDAPALREMVGYVGERWRVDAQRVLLTGLSDGATYALYSGLREDSVFTALAPVSGVLHPANLSNGNLERARDRPIYLVHGALDWMFPVQMAHLTRDELEKAGARLVYREIADLSHAYPREENARIVDWLLDVEFARRYEPVPR